MKGRTGLVSPLPVFDAVRYAVNKLQNLGPDKAEFRMALSPFGSERVQSGLLAFCRIKQRNHYGGWWRGAGSKSAGPASKTVVLTGFPKPTAVPLQLGALGGNLPECTALLIKSTHSVARLYEHQRDTSTASVAR